MGVGVVMELTTTLLLLLLLITTTISIIIPKNPLNQQNVLVN
jgi:hypothetical protein